MNADENSATEPTSQGPVNGDREAESGVRESAIDAALAAYEAALEDWRGRGAEIAAEQADIPWVTSAEEIIHARASDAAMQVLDQRHHAAGGVTSFAQDLEYWREMQQLRRELGEAKPPPIRQDAGEQSRAADTAYENDAREQDAGPEMSIE